MASTGDAATYPGTAAVIAGLVADAAANNAHWIYDPPKLAGHLKDLPSIAFCQPPARNLFTVPDGHFTCYGDQTFVLLQSLVAMRGFDPEDYCKRLVEKFGKGGPYEVEATDQENWPTYKAEKKFPLEGPWRHGSIQHFLRNYVTEGKRFPECGSTTDHLIDCCCRVIPVVALYAGRDTLLPTCEQVIRVTQNNDEAVAHGCAYARMLEARILQVASSISEARKQAIAAIKDPSRKFTNPLDAEVVQLLEEIESKYGKMPTSEVGALLQPANSAPHMGLNCHIPQAVVLPLHVGEEQSDYKTGVEAAIVVAGTSASRAMVVGALLGTGSVVPDEWLEKTAFSKDILELCAQLETLRRELLQ
mmetsp:Transcript_67869/g.126813  ORF Transcript_67869/g.126813 Transcript_67869/m.126813 type:complete len:361 (-) Transcript_67869:160-1242(-)